MAVPPDATETEIDRPRLRTTRAGVATAGDGAIGGPGGWRWRRPLSARRCWRRGPPLVPGRRRGRRRRRRVCDAKPGRARPAKTAGHACAALLDHGRGRSVDSLGADAAVRPRRDRGAYRARAHGRRRYAGTGSRRLERWWAWASATFVGVSGGDRLGRRANTSADRASVRRQSWPGVGPA